MEKTHRSKFGTSEMTKNTFIIQCTGEIIIVASERTKAKWCRKQESRALAMRYVFSVHITELYAILNENPFITANRNQHDFVLRIILNDVIVFSAH